MQPITAYRNTGVDILRGLVMIIMALDHTREFFHTTALTADPLNAEITTPVLFFTRWITHYCAPVFVFLSGVSAFLTSSRKPRKEGSVSLMKRGLFLVIAEITIVTFGLGFNPTFNFIFLQVIWVIGMSLILLGLCRLISDKWVLAIGIVLFVGHNVLDFFKIPGNGVEGGLWNIFFLAKGSVIPYAPGRLIIVLYALLPWTGVLFMGYSIGHWFTQNFQVEKRIRNLRIAGISMILLYVILRVTGIYGDPTQWNSSGHFMMSFLNTEKYPPSLQFLGMTLGPAILLLSFLERTKPDFAFPVQVYGRVPFFYYILHFYLLHIIGIITFFAAGYPMSKATETFIIFRPNDFGYSLTIVYLIWAFVVLALYFPCRWYFKYKQGHKQWWLKYI